MKKIPVGHCKFALVDDEDYEKISNYSWRLKKTTNTWYAQRNSYPPLVKKCTTIHMHREILGLNGGKTVDHINGNGLDNRRTNLRICSQADNTLNRATQKNNRSGFKGVCFRGGKLRPWGAKIVHKDISYWLGTFATAKDAAHAYDKAAIKIHGEFARLNFPDRTQQ